MRGGYRPRLSRSAWHRAIVLMVLSGEGEPMSIPGLCFRLLTDATTIHTELQVLMAFGAVVRQQGPARRWLYEPSQIVALAAA